MVDVGEATILYWQSIRRQNVQHEGGHNRGGRQCDFFFVVGSLDCSVKAIKLNQIDVTVNVELPVAIFVRNPPLLALIVVIPLITNAVLDDFPVDG